MTIAAPTNKRMISVPILKMRPRTLSRISRMATIPTSPNDWSVAARSRSRRVAPVPDRPERRVAPEPSAFCAVSLRARRRLLVIARRRVATAAAMRMT